MIITISGHSDDIVTIGPRGAPHADEEYSYGDGGIFIELSTGQVFRVEYAEWGVWRVAQVAGSTDGVLISVCPATEDDENNDDYTDVATIECPEGTKWCPWPIWPPVRLHSVVELIEERASDYLEKLSDEEIFTAYRKLQSR